MRNAARRLAAALVFALAFLPAGAEKAREEKVSVCFSPGEDCARALVREIEGAKKTLHVGIYYFSLKPVAEALIEAQARRVKVQVIMDKSQRSTASSALPLLAAAGIPVLVDTEHAIYHNKIVVVDERTVVTGSFNFTQGAASRNAENLVVLRNFPETAALYLQDWNAHARHATLAASPEGAPAMVTATKAGSRYHCDRACRHVRRRDSPGVYLVPLALAEEAWGLKACGRCCGG